MMAADKMEQVVGPRAPADELKAHRMRYLWPTLCFAGAAILIIVSIFMPYWSLVLHAPQYPGGLVVHAYVNHLEDNGLDSHRYRLVLWQQLSLPVGILAMALLGVPFVVGSTRTMAAGTRISIGIVVGILFYLTERTLGQVPLCFRAIGCWQDLVVAGHR